MTAEFPCARCGAPIPIPEAARRDATMSLVCSACGQRYVRRAAGATAGGAPTGPAASTVTPKAPVAPAPPGTVPTTRGWTPPARPQAARAPTRPLSDARAAELAAFRAGEFVGNRYRIVRFVARGGMGEVYEADDLELRG